MSNPSDPGTEPPRLAWWERTISIGIGLFAFFFGTLLVTAPPELTSTTSSAKEGTVMTIAQHEVSSVAIAMFTAGLVFLFYALNGLRLTKFAAGGLSGEANTGSTQPLNPSPSAAAAPAKIAQSNPVTTFDSFSEEQKKIMRTLWRYQQANFGSEFSKRWTFKISPNLPEYPEYLSAVSALVKQGYVSVNPANDQIALTNEAILLLNSVGDRATRGSFYIF